MNNLPKVTAFEIKEKLNNSQERFYGSSNTIEENEKPRNIMSKINDIFADSSYVYKKRARITLKNDIVSSIKSVGKMSDNVNKILEDNQTKEIIADVNETMKNLSEISQYVNEYTKDPKLKEDLTSTISNLSTVTENIARIMDDYNRLEDCDKMKLKNTVKDIQTITQNVKKFSQKLNKRFLLFRLMF